MWNRCKHVGINGVSGDRWRLYASSISEYGTWTCKTVYCLNTNPAIVTSCGCIDSPSSAEAPPLDISSVSKFVDEPFQPKENPCGRSFQTSRKRLICTSWCTNISLPWSKIRILGPFPVSGPTSSVSIFPSASRESRNPLPWSAYIKTAGAVLESIWLLK